MVNLKKFDITSWCFGLEGVKTRKIAVYSRW